MQPPEGMQIDDLWREGAAKVLLVVGKKYPGSGTPMIGAVTADGTLLWKAEVARTNALAVREFTVSARGGSVVTSVLDEVDKQYVVVAWELATGRRRWEVTLPKKLLFPTVDVDLPDYVPFEQWCAGLAQTDQQVVVACSETLRAYAVEDGKVLWSLYNHGNKL
jgi:hypothetical protein